jgi:hypothetical protein
MEKGEVWKQNMNGCWFCRVKERYSALMHAAGPLGRKCENENTEGY